MRQVNLEDLPEELILQIFTCVPTTPSTRAHLCLINKRMNRIATPLLYHSFSSGDEFSCHRYLETIAAKPKLSQYVHVLNWLGVPCWEEDESDELLTKALMHQSNLQHVSWRNDECDFGSDTDSEGWTYTEYDLEIEKRRSVKPFRERWLEHHGFSTSNIFQNLQSADLAMRNLRLSDIVWLMRIPTLQKLWLNAILRYDSEDRIPRSLEPHTSNVRDLSIRLYKRVKPGVCDIASFITACRRLNRLSLDSYISVLSTSNANTADGTLQKLLTAIELHSTTLKSLALGSACVDSADQHFLSAMETLETLETLDISPRAVPWPLIRTIRQLPRTIRTIRITPENSQLVSVLLARPTDFEDTTSRAVREKITVYLCLRDILKEGITFDHWNDIKQRYSSYNVALELFRFGFHGGFPWGRDQFTYTPRPAEQDDASFWRSGTSQG